MLDQPALKALDWFLTNHDENRPMDESPWAFFNAHPWQSANIAPALLACEQRNRSTFLALEKSGLKTVTRFAEEQVFSGAVLLTTRSRAFNEALLARAVAVTGIGGSIYLCGEKTTGIDALIKRVRRRDITIDTASKFHSKIARLTTSKDVATALDNDLSDLDVGFFNEGKPDAGSELLVQTFDGSITGDVADFCSGTGVLAEGILERSAPKSLHLFENDLAALERSKLIPENADIAITHQWLDLSCEQPDNRFDWIVMNPPFHQGRAAEPHLGQSIIETAAKCLRSGGTLRLVANRKLPYEQILAEKFASWQEITANNGFKVLEARR